MQERNDYESDHSISDEVENTNSEAKENEVASYKILSFDSFIPEQYRSFVFSRWLHSLRFGNDMFKLTKSDIYYDVYGKKIEQIIKRPKTKTRVAVLSEDQDTALGWSVEEPETLHYVFVKPEVRSLGIAKELVSKDIKTISHITHTGLAIWHKKMPYVNFNPFF